MTATLKPNLDNKSLHICTSWSWGFCWESIPRTGSTSVTSWENSRTTCLGPLTWKVKIKFIMYPWVTQKCIYIYNLLLPLSFQILLNPLTKVVINQSPGKSFVNPISAYKCYTNNSIYFMKQANKNQQQNVVLTCMVY